MFGQDILKIENLLVIGVITATIVAAFILRWRGKRRLLYWFSVFPLVQEHSSDKIVIQFDKEVFENVYICIIGLRYKGEPAIKKNEYESRVTFSFKDARVLDGEVFETEPLREDADVLTKADDATIDANIAVLKPIVLNNKNQLTARVLLTEPNTPSVGGVITNVDSIKNEDEEREWPLYLLVTSGLLLIAYNAWFVWFGMTQQGRSLSELMFASPVPTAGSALVFTTIIIVLMWGSVWMLRKFRRRNQRQRYQHKVESR